MKKEKLPIVYVEWEDAQSSHGWRKVEDDDLPCLVKSVGILVSDFKQCVTISTSKSEFGNFCDKLTIPKQNIKKFKRIREN